MAAENIGNLIPTKIPSLIDNADIQEALRLYHYGSYDFDIAETSSSNLINPSIAYTINSLQNQITAQVALELAARNSSRVSNDAPVAADFTSFMTGIPDGYVWMDKNAQSSIGYFAATSIYTTTAPTENLTNGLIWVEKGSSPLKMYVYNSTTSTFDQIGA
jgi:hypothetical protein